MLDLPPELIDQILYYLTNPEVKACLDAAPIFQVLTKMRTENVIVRSKPLYHGYITNSSRYATETYETVGLYLDYQETICEMVKLMVYGNHILIFQREEELQNFIEDNVLDEDPESLDSFGQYLRSICRVDNDGEIHITMDRDVIINELLKLIDMTSFESAKASFEHLCLDYNGWLHDNSFQCPYIDMLYVR